MPSVTRSAEVAASPSDVFTYLEAGEHVGEWLPDVYRSERLTPGPVIPGTRFLYVFRVLGRDFEIVNEVTEVERPVLLGFRAVAGIANRGRFEVTSLDHGRRSQVTLWFSFDLPAGPVGLLARHLPVEAIVDRYAQASLGRLVGMLEARCPRS